MIDYTILTQILTKTVRHSGHYQIPSVNWQTVTVDHSGCVAREKQDHVHDIVHICNVNTNNDEIYRKISSQAARIGFHTYRKLYPAEFVYNS